jgi:ribonucleoside-diphosphate reductase beta chain
MADLDQVLDDWTQFSRSYSDWGSPKGLDTASVPWRLWEKAKQSHWDPAAIDFSQDAADWKKLPDEQRLALAGLARGFMVGEEGVTLDILPLVECMADLGRTEDTIYLTSFTYEEAKHVDFFRRWFDTVGIDLAEMDVLVNERRAKRGMPPIDRDRQAGLFERELPRVMRRLRVDHSPEAILDAGVTYNQFVEGCLALAGYKVWGHLFSTFGVMPGLQEGLGYVRTDESRHITYGTYLARRIIAENPELIDRARDRMYALRDGMLGGGGYGGGGGNGGSGAQGGNGGDRAQEGADALFAPFVKYALDQVERRVKILEKAVGLSATDAAAGLGAEEAEADAESAAVDV